MKSAYDVIIRPVITEQSMEDLDIKKFVFEVAKDATKVEIKKAVEEIFGVTGQAMIVTENVDENVIKSARNIPGVETTIATILSPYEIMKARALVVDKAALSKIEEVYC